MSNLKDNSDLFNNITSCLQRIADILSSNVRFINYPGFLNGKMGIAIFLFHYARYTGNEKVESFAGELIDQVYNEIHHGMMTDFADGLTGIGWGIEYLVQNGFLEADTDEVLSEVDNSVYGGFMHTPFLIQIQNRKDLNGAGLYYLARLKSMEGDEDRMKTLEKKQTLIYLTDSCERLLTKEKWAGHFAPKLSMEQLNSVVFFLNEIKKLALFPVKIASLQSYIPNNSEYMTHKMNVDKFTLWTLIKEFRKNQKKNTLPFETFSLELLDNNEPASADDETIVTEFIRCNWNTLLYDVDFTSNETFRLYYKKVLAMINEEIWWNNFIDKLNSRNLGLNNGIAGLGMSLLQFSKASVQHEFSDKTGNYL